MTYNAAIDTLKTGMWRLGQIQNFNDPFDCLFAFKHKNLSVPEDFFSSFSQRFRNQEFSKYGILCFSRLGNQPAMWVHYAEQMKGVCLECEISDDSLFEVSYSEERLVFDVTSDDYLNSQKCRDDVIEIIRHKHKSWEYEAEVRLFIDIKDKRVIRRSLIQSAYCKDARYFTPIAENTLKRIIFGPAMSAQKFNFLLGYKDKTKFASVPVVKSKLHASKFEIEY